MLESLYTTHLCYNELCLGTKVKIRQRGDGPLSNTAIFLLTLASICNVRNPVQTRSGQGGSAVTSEVKEVTRRLVLRGRERVLPAASSWRLCAL